MSFWFAAVTAIATVNPLRVWPGLPGRTRDERVETALLGAIVVLGGLVVVVLVAEPLLDALDISDPTARIAAGVAVAMIAVRDGLSASARVDPALPGRRGALVPVAVPHLFTPGFTLLVVGARVDIGVGRAVLVVLVALGVVIGAAVWPAPSGVGARVTRAGHVLTAGLAIVLGAALVLDGVLDI